MLKNNTYDNSGAVFDVTFFPISFERSTFKYFCPTCPSKRRIKNSFVSNQLRTINLSKSCKVL